MGVNVHARALSAVGCAGLMMSTEIAAAPARLSRFDQGVEWLHGVLFFEVLGAPLIVLWLVVGSCYFTVRFRFINVRAFKHALDLVRGRYDDPDDPGEVTHFQALASALSATVGLGNIAGVGIAVSLGGPGAVFWIVVAGFLGMTTKFVECTLAQIYRDVGPDGEVTGGPMVYLSKGLGELGWPRLGRALAVAFALFCVGGSLGAGNMFQANQSLEAVAQVFPAMRELDWVFGSVLSLAVGVVILGGIQRIARTAARLVPTMCGLYLAAAAVVILTHLAELPGAIASIVAEAFSPQALYGGALGVLVIGVQRAAFSNEAGVGSAAIAHSAAKTAYPVREGMVASLGPFIDSVVVCTMTGLVIVISGAHQLTGTAAMSGAALTSSAFATVLDWFPYVLSVATVLFAYSTMIAWSYYGERCWIWLFGRRGVLVYRLTFCGCVVLGAVMGLGAVLDLSDMMVLAMAFPNILGLYLLSGKVSRALGSYWR